MHDHCVHRKVKAGVGWALWERGEGGSMDHAAMVAVVTDAS